METIRTSGRDRERKRPEVALGCWWAEEVSQRARPVEGGALGSRAGVAQEGDSSREEGRSECW